MPKVKIRDHYYLKCNGVLVEVSEEVYRTWTYYYNKEQTTAKQYYNRIKTMPDGTKIVLPSRCISLDEDPKHLSMPSKINLEAAFSHKEIRRLLDDAISRLDSTYETVIRSIFFTGKTEQELAKELGKCQATISNYKQNALRILRSHLEKCEYSISELLEMLDE